jgi:hypothetical protein
MTTLLLVVLASYPVGDDGCGCQQAPAPVVAPVAVSPDVAPARGGTSQQGRPRLFGWLRGRRHDNNYPYAGNGHTDGGWAPVAAAPAPAVGAAPVVETVLPQPAPTVVASPPAAEQPPRQVPRLQPVPTSAEPPLAATPDAAPRRMPQGAAVPISAEPPGN